MLATETLRLLLLFVFTLSLHAQPLPVHDPGRMPQRIRIGPYHYAVEVVSKLTSEDRVADINWDTLVIHILQSSPPDMQRESLWHEVEHACIHLNRNEADAEDEDDWIELIAPCEIMVLEDNPALVEFLVPEPTNQGRAAQKSPRKEHP